MFVSACALCFAKSSKKDSKEKKSAPVWISDQGRLSVFPNSDFVSALAEGSSPDEAKTKALAAIAQSIKASVSSQTKSRYSAAQDKYGIDKKKFIETSQSVKSEGDIYMVETTAPFYDASMGIYYCVAYINRNKAFEYVRPTLEKALEVFPTECEKVSAEDDGFKKILLTKRNLFLLKDFYSVYDFARFINMEEANKYNEVDRLCFVSLAKMNELKSTVALSVKATGEGSQDIKECLKKILNDEGFSLSDTQTTHVVAAEVSAQIIKSEKVFSSYPSVTVEVKRKSDGKLSASYSNKLGKTAAFDESGAKQKAVFAIKKDLETNFINKL